MKCNLSFFGVLVVYRLRYFARVLNSDILMLLLAKGRQMSVDGIFPFTIGKGPDWYMGFDQSPIVNYVIVKSEN